MSKRTTTYPLWLALASSLCFGLAFILSFAEEMFAAISCLLALISLIGSCLNLKARNKVQQSIIAMILSLIPFCVLLWAQLDSSFRMRQHSRGHGSAYTLGDMRKLAFAIQFFLEDTNIEMPQQLDKIFQTLYGHEEIPVIFTCQPNEPEELKKGKWNDYWGRPITLTVNSPTEYKLVSYGYNGKDDQEKKDDLVTVFNPLKTGEIDYIRK